jgi:hypothetical protein
MSIRHLNVEKTSVLKCRIVRKQRRKFSSLLHISVSSESLASQVLLKESLGPILLTVPVAVCGAMPLRLWSTSTTVPNSCPVISISLDLTSITWLQQTPTWNTGLFNDGIQALVPQWGTCLYIKGEYLEVWCVPYDIHFSCAHQSQNKFLSFRVSVVFLETLLCI